MENVVHEPQKTSRAGGPPVAASPGGSAAARTPTKRSRGRAYATALVVGLGALAFAGTPTVALAADDCPNAAVRAQQGVQHLPNCLAYERVTPDDKRAGFPTITDIARDGRGVVFNMKSVPVGTEVESFLEGKYRVLRDGAGWSSTPLMPRFDLGRVPITADAFNDPGQMSADMSRVIISGEYPLHPNDKGALSNGDGSHDSYIREPDGTFTWVTGDPDVVDTSTQVSNVVRGDASLDRAVVSSSRRSTPEIAAEGTFRLFLWTRGAGMQLLSRLPDGSVPATAVDQRRWWVSADLDRVGFTVGSGAARRAYVRFDPGTPGVARTEELVGPNGETCLSAWPVRVSEDGRRVLFTCHRTSSDPPTALETGAYLRDLDAGPRAVRPLPQSIGSLGTADSAEHRIKVTSDDLSIVWGANVAGDLLVWRNGDAPQQVGPSGSALQVRVAGDHGDTYASPSGEYFAFVPQVPANAPQVPGTDHGGRSQVFMASASTGQLRCVSCAADGSSTLGSADLGAQNDVIVGVPGSKYGITPVSDRGSVAFSSSTPLDARDTNGQYDAYAWIDGRSVLLSSGTTRRGAASFGGSSDGSTFVFATSDALVGDDRDGGQYDLYAARSGGGYLLPPQGQACDVNCRGSVDAPSAPPVVATSTGRSSGNVEEADDVVAVKRATVGLTSPASVRGTSLTLRVRASRAGTVRVSGVGLRARSVRVQKAGTQRVTVRLSAYGAKRQRSRGRLATRVTARLTPSSGAPVTARKAVTFTRAGRKGGR